jgi:hypothetical protein
VRIRVVVAALGGLVAAFASSRGQGARPRPAGVIDGLVTDTNLVVLDDATVSILGSAIRVTTGDNGRFRILGLRAGNYVLTVHHIGYVPVAVAMGVVETDTLRPAFALQRIARVLDTMVVTERSLTQRLTEFEGRRKLGLGHFITAEEIDKRNSVYVADIIRVVPSVGIAGGTAGVQVAHNIRGSHGAGQGIAGCPFQLFLDGVPMPPETNLANLPPPREFAGIEIYSGPATIPLQYKYGTASCGVILFWTKTG